jgi:hypothetical protein
VTKIVQLATNNQELFRVKIPLFYFNQDALINAQHHFFQIKQTLFVNRAIKLVIIVMTLQKINALSAITFFIFIINLVKTYAQPNTLNKIIIRARIVEISALIA